MPKSVGEKKVVGCSCGYSSEETDKLEIKSKGVPKGKEIEVVEEDAHGVMPLTDEVCPKCKHGKAYYWLVQTRAGDEPETRFFRCKECKHTWRDY